MAEKNFISVFLDGLKNLFKQENKNSCDRGPLCIDIQIGPDVADDSEVVCSICITPYILSTSAVMLICGHYFHVYCYDEWKQTCIRNSHIISCPNCRG